MSEHIRAIRFSLIAATRSETSAPRLRSRWLQIICQRPCGSGGIDEGLAQDLPSGLANEPGNCAVHIRSLMKSSGNQRKIPVDADVAGRVDRVIETIIIGFLVAAAIPAILIVGVLLYQWWILRHPIEPGTRP